MTITLTPKQQDWIKEHIALGEFSSPEEAALRLIDAAIVERDFADAGDLAWAKPLVDEALAEVTRGEVVTFEEYKADVKAFLDMLKG